MIDRILLSFCFLAFCFAPYQAKAAEDAPYIVILHYKDIGGTPGQSVSLEQFQKHLDILQKDGRNVMSFHMASNFLNKAKPGEVGYVISIENLTAANLPAIYGAVKDAKMSYIAFLDPAEWGDEEGKKYLQESETSGHAAYGVTTVNMPSNETDFQVEMNKVVSDYRTLLPTGPDYFLFQEGIYNNAMIEVLQNYDFDVTVGGAQGMVTKSKPVWPRYDVTYQNAEPSRFRELLDIKPLHVTDITPTETLLEDINPKVGFTVKDPIDNKDNLRCFLQGKGAQKVTFLSGERVEIRPELEAGRKHYMNCILRNEKKDGDFSYRWLGFLLQVPAPDIPEIVETDPASIIEGTDTQGSIEEPLEGDEEVIIDGAVSAEEASEVIEETDASLSDELPEPQE